MSDPKFNDDGRAEVGEVEIAVDLTHEVLLVASDAAGSYVSAAQARRLAVLLLLGADRLDTRPF